MASTNVIQLAPALQRRRERQGDGGYSANRHGAWDRHYPSGIDGLWAAVPQAIVIPLVRS